VDRHRFEAVPDPDPSFHFDADQIRILDGELKFSGKSILYILLKIVKLYTGFEMDTDMDRQAMDPYLQQCFFVSFCGPQEDTVPVPYPRCTGMLATKKGSGATVPTG
jgi:hypothetical protein